jgi:anaerobic selenocysteine-containing dehydrogenase
MACSAATTPKNAKYDKTSWNYELDENFAKRDTTLQHPRCVWNLLKQHVSRYTPDVVENICGTPKADFLKVCEYIAETSAKIKPRRSCTPSAGRSTPSVRRTSVPWR